MVELDLDYTFLWLYFIVRTWF